MAGRKFGQELVFGFTGKKLLTLKTQEVFLYGSNYIWKAIVYGKGVIAAEQYHGRINAEKFSSFDCEHFVSMLKKVLTQGVWL